MKSKLFLMISVLVVALMSTTLAGAQVRAQKVNLPCQMWEPWQGEASHYRVDMQNDTGAWLSQGTTIYFQVDGWHTGHSSPWVGPIEKKVLSEMIPVGGTVHLMDPMMKPTYDFDLIQGYFNCKAWYLK